jgi:hypothetical protein
LAAGTETLQVLKRSRVLLAAGSFGKGKKDRGGVFMTMNDGPFRPAQGMCVNAPRSFDWVGRVLLIFQRIHVEVFRRGLQTQARMSCGLLDSGTCREEVLGWIFRSSIEDVVTAYSYTELGSSPPKVSYLYLRTYRCRLAGSIPHRFGIGFPKKGNEIIPGKD